MDPAHPLSVDHGGLAGRLAPEVLAGLGALSRVSRALVSGGTLAELAAHALCEMRLALGLAVAALYLPDPDGRPSLRRLVASEAGEVDLRARTELSFDAEAWRLAVASGHALVFREPASWLVANPFEPEAEAWLVLPLTPRRRLIGVVVAASAVPVELDPTSATVLSLLGDQLSAGIATARLRQELQRVELERERMRLAAEVHDGLAQDLALAVREVALIDSRPSDALADASWARLREAVQAAHQIVRARLVDLVPTAPLGGIATAVQDACDAFARRGLPVRLHTGNGTGEVAPVTTAALIRVLSEALGNAERHAAAGAVVVRLERDGERVHLTVEDDGCGFDLEAVAGPERAHFGLALMRERAEAAGGRLAVESRPGRGTHVKLALPAAAAAATVLGA